MASIYFAGTYPPIMCGIATYTNYLTREIPAEKWGMLSFDLVRYGARQPGRHDMEISDVWYGIPGADDFTSTTFQTGLNQLGAGDDAILWIQHESAIWENSDMLIRMLKTIKIPSVVTFHTLHFQSNETPFGLRQNQHELLEKLLPHVDAITVFSYGVFRAVTSAFPKYYEKVFVLKHGVHSYPNLVKLSRKEAKAKLLDFLLYDSDIDHTTRERIYNKRIFTDQNTILIGQTGFLCPSKQSESLYLFRNNLQKVTPEKRIVAIRIGGPRQDSHKKYASRIRSELNGLDEFLLETWLPQDILPLAQRAFDFNFYWPSQCTQSGVVAHALGTGAIVAGRDMEGIGETLKEAGELVDTDMGNLMMKTRSIIKKHDIGEEIEESALNYAQRYSWQNQACQHYELARIIVDTVPLWKDTQRHPNIGDIADPRI